MSLQKIPFPVDFYLPQAHNPLDISYLSRTALTLA